MNKKWWGVGLVGTALVAGVVAYAVMRSRFDGEFNALKVDLRHPDVVLRSGQLSQLPKDLVQAPLLRGILTEDFVHYYEEHPTGLSLIGTLKRLAYEHQLTLPDRLISLALDAPGELALWRDGKGRPEYFVLSLQHPPAAKALLEMAKVALPDKQLSVAGEVGSSKVYALRLNARTTWLFATRGMRTVVLSHPGLLLDDNGQASAAAVGVIDDALDAGEKKASPFAADFGLEAAPAARHQIAARTSYLSFGYQHFFPGVTGLRLDMAGKDKTWTVHARANGAALDAWRKGAATLWTALPRNSALCASLPLDPARAKPLLQSLAGPQGEALAQDLEPVAAVCWNTQGGLFAPLLALQLKPSGEAARHDAVMSVLLDKATRQDSAPSRDSDDDEESAGDASTEAPGEVQAKALNTPAGSQLWTRRIPHEFGAVRQGGVRANVVALARVGNVLLASTDARALEPALAVAAKTFPALADDTMRTGTAVLAMQGPQLAKMLDTETWRVLRPSVAPTFHRVARELLPPRVKALGELGSVRVGLPAASNPGGDALWISLPVEQTAVVSKDGS